MSKLYTGGELVVKVMEEFGAKGSVWCPGRADTVRDRPNAGYGYSFYTYKT